MKKIGKKESHEGAKSMRTLLLFCAVVLLLILASLTIKFISVLNQSTYDDKHRFTLLVEHSKKDATILSFDPSTKTVSEVFLRGDKAIYNPGKYLGIPINGKVQDIEKYTDTTNIPDKLLSYILTLKNKEQGLTSVDVLRLWLLTSPLQKKDFESEKLSTNLSEDEVDQKLEELFVDEALANEKVTVEIINATGITGRGSKLERMLTNIGIPVVQVTTASRPENYSSIQYADDATYTVKKLRQLLKYEASQMAEQGLSDIIIVVGRDSESHPLF
jgi:hypothetical protein